MNKKMEWYRDESSLEQEVRARTAVRTSPPLIDGYDEMREISRGGQGVVYVGRQRSTKRQVAIKVLLDGAFASGSSRLRFEREIDLVAGLRHPNIVSVYDSGTTSDGRLYLVMEYIDGPALTDYIEQKSVANNLGVDERMKLFARICGAVNCAHQHGIIHRDLKPGNILVDAHGEPHILDFGLAKEANRGAAGDSSVPVVSVSGQFMGSLPWACPEQAEGNFRDTDVRSDIYSLGVICYQMLTTQFPYEITGNLRDVLDNILRTDPLRPSSFSREINDEVDTIVLKCLSKEPERRYQSAGELEADVRRYLAGEPIEAKRNSSWYALRKRFRRYRLAAYAMGVVLLISVAFGVFAWRQYQQTQAARESERIAHESERKAHDKLQTEATKAMQVQAFLRDMLASTAPEFARGRDPELLLAVLDKASERIEQELGDQPLVAAELHRTIGSTYQHLSRYEQANTHMTRALDLNTEHLGPLDPETLRTKSDLGVLRTEQSQPVEAERLFRETLQVARTLPGENTEILVKTMNNLSVLLRRVNRLDEAEALTEEALDLQVTAKGEDDPGSLELLNNYSSLLQTQGKLEESEPYLRRALESFTRTKGADSPGTIITAGNLGYLLKELGRIEEAEQIMRRNLQLAERVMGPDNAITLGAVNNLGALLCETERYEEGERLVRRACEGRTRILGEEHDYTLISMNNLSTCLQNQEKIDEAVRIQRQSVEVLRRRYGDQNLSTMIGMNNLGTLLVGMGQLDEAEEIERSVVEAATASLGKEHLTTALFQSNYANTLAKLGRFEEAEPIQVAAYRTTLKALGPKHDHTETARLGVVQLYEGWGKPEKAEEFAKPAETGKASEPAAPLDEE